MHNITFEFAKLHRHGSAFYDFLKLRKQIFVDELGWEVPHNDEVEMDQYDTPVAHYSLVVRNGEVIGGARGMSTEAIWGSNTYMLRDAHNGKLSHIPSTVLRDEIATPRVWECTRLVISPRLSTNDERRNCLRLIVDGLVEQARARGAETLICLSSCALMRTLRQLGYAVSRIGPSYRNGEDGRLYAVLSMPAGFSAARRADWALAHPLPVDAAPMVANAR